MSHIDFFRAWAAMLAAILIAGLLVAAAFATGADAQEVTLTGETVVLDPGHGGSDSGAVNGTYRIKEKDQNLDVAYRLKALLEASGATVYMTRGGDPSNPNGPGVKDPGDDAFADDATLSNTDRYTYANSTGARILVSIHMNGSSDPDQDYTTTLFGKWRKDKELAYAVFGGLSTLPAASGTGTIRTRSPYSYASGVLLKSNMPATIAETVFITNNAEAALLSDGTGSRQQQIAEALGTGIENYLSTH
jgi:N-acetylmuramoyl-L-alanine amidase